MTATVRAARVFPGSVHEAERCWYDIGGWPAWVDGLARIIDVGGNWPRAGASVTWESGPAGRGRVVERVVAYDELAGQTLEVQDDSIRGRQTVAFTPDGDRVEVALSLDYEIKRRSILTPVVDRLFIRRAMEGSLVATVARFGVELADRRERGGH